MQSSYFNRILNLKKERLKIILWNNSDTFNLRFSYSDNRVKNQSELEKLIRKKNSVVNQQIQKSSKDSFKSNQKKNFPALKKKLLDSQLNYRAQIKNHQVKEEDRIKLLTQNINSFIHTEKNKQIDFYRNSLISSEKDYLQSASFNTRQSTLDPKGLEILNTFPFLNRSSVDPRHLTILHSSLAEKVANLIHERNFNNTNNSVFIDIQPGASLITEKLLQKKTNSSRKFILIESHNKFIKHQIEIKSKYETKDDEIHLISGKPFEENFLYRNTETRRKLIQLIKPNNNETKSKLTFFNILPWNSKGYMQRLFGDFYLNRGFFRLSIENNLDPDFYLFLPELLVAKLNPTDSNKNYNGFKSALSVHASIFSDCEIIGEESAEHFFPYPQVSTPYRYNAYPYNKLDLKRLFLVNLKFKPAYMDNQTQVLNTKSDKRFFYFFVMQLFSRPAARLKDVLNTFCRDVENVCRINGLNQYFTIKQLQPFQFYYLFKYLNDNPDILHLKSLEKALSQGGDSIAESEPARKENQLKMLKESNQKLSGQLIIPWALNVPEKKNNLTDENLSEKEHLESKFEYDLLNEDQFDDKNHDFDEPEFYEKKSSIFIK